MNQEFSYVHWIDRILHNRPFRLLMGASIGKCKVVLQLSTFLLAPIITNPLNPAQRRNPAALPSALPVLQQEAAESAIASLE